MKRREALKSLGNACLAPLILNPAIANSTENFVDFPSCEEDSKFVQFDKPLTRIMGTTGGIKVVKLCISN